MPAPERRAGSSHAISTLESASVGAIAIDPSSAMPPWLQLKEQLKVAYACGHLRPGEVLPSIRAMSARLHVGQGIVRRAYNELIALGLLTAVERKGFTVAHRQQALEECRQVTEEAARECDRILAWARERKISSIALSRLLNRRALAVEAEAPSYTYVSASSTAARNFAGVIGKAWEVRMAGWSLEELAALPKARIESLAGIVVNHLRYEDVMSIVPAGFTRVFTITLHLNPKLVRRMRRLPAGSRVLLLFPENDIDSIGGVVIDLHEKIVGTKLRYECDSLERAGDLSRLIDQGDHALIVVSIHLWDRIPEELRRKAKVVCSQFEPDPHSMEDARLRAGVLA